MKRFPLLLILLGCIQISCEKKPENETDVKKEPTVLSLSGIKNYTAEPQELSLTVKCDVKWDLELSDGSWAKIVSKNETGEASAEVMVSIGMNRTQEDRKQLFTLKSGTKSFEFEITQQGLSSIIDTDGVILSGTETSSFIISMKTPWSISIADGADWFSVTPSEGDGSSRTKIKVTPVDGNLNVGDRVSAIDIHVGGDKLSIPVVQGQTDVILVGVSQQIANGRDQDLTIASETNVPYTVRIPEDIGWISYVPPTKALDKRNVIIHLEANLSGEVRKALVYLEKDQLSEAVTIQQAPYHSILESSTPGAYWLEGETYLYRAGVHQLATGISNGFRYYRLMDPEHILLVNVSGIPDKDPVLCDSFDLTIKVASEEEGVIYQASLPVVVVDVSDTRVWLATGEDEAVILKK